MLIFILLSIFLCIKHFGSVNYQVDLIKYNVDKFAKCSPFYEYFSGLYRKLENIPATSQALTYQELQHLHDLYLVAR